MLHSAGNFSDHFHYVLADRWQHVCVPNVLSWVHPTAHRHYTAHPGGTTMVSLEVVLEGGKERGREGGGRGRKRARERMERGGRGREGGRGEGRGEESTSIST